MCVFFSHIEKNTSSSFSSKNCFDPVGWRRFRQEGDSALIEYAVSNTSWLFIISSLKLAKLIKHCSPRDQEEKNWHAMEYVFVFSGVRVWIYFSLSLLKMPFRLQMVHGCYWWIDGEPVFIRAFPFEFALDAFVGDVGYTLLLSHEIDSKARSKENTKIITSSANKCCSTYPPRSQEVMLCTCTILSQYVKLSLTNRNPLSRWILWNNR